MTMKKELLGMEALFLPEGDFRPDGLSDSMVQDSLEDARADDPPELTGEDGSDGGSGEPMTRDLFAESVDLSNAGENMMLLEKVVVGKAPLLNY